MVNFMCMYYVLWYFCCSWNRSKCISDRWRWSGLLLLRRNSFEHLTDSLHVIQQIFRESKKKKKMLQGLCAWQVSRVWRLLCYPARSSPISWLQNKNPGFREQKDNRRRSFCSFSWRRNLQNDTRARLRRRTEHEPPTLFLLTGAELSGASCGWCTWQVPHTALLQKYRTFPLGALQPSKVFLMSLLSHVFYLFFYPNAQVFADIIKVVRHDTNYTAPPADYNPFTAAFYFKESQFVQLLFLF